MDEVMRINGGYAWQAAISACTHGLPFRATRS